MKSQYTIHPDIAEMMVEWQDEAAEFYSPIMEAHKWARENVGDLAAKYAADKKPSFQANSKRMAQTIFDAIVPRPDSPVDIALTALPMIPGFTKVSALGEMASDITGMAGRMSPEASSGLKRLIGEITDSYNPQLYKPILGPRPGSGWGYNPVEETAGRFVKDVWTPTAAKPSIKYSPREVKEGLEASYNPTSEYFRAGHNPEVPFQGLKASFGHEMGHHRARQLTMPEYRDVFGIPRSAKSLEDIPDFLPRMKADWMDYINTQGPKPWFIRDYPEMGKAGMRLNYYLESPNARPLEEMLADYFALVSTGHDPANLFRRTIITPELMTEPMRLKTINQFYGKP